MLKEIIKTKEDFQKMLEIFTDKAIKKEAISENPFRDGIILGILYYLHFTFFISLINNNPLEGRILDGTIQKLELINNWLQENEEKLYNILCQELK